MSNKVAVIGGGASGMMAAIYSASKGNKVTIFEKNQTLGKKILLTGNGRCNITNSDVSWKNYFGSSPKFASSVLSQFSNSDTIQFFEDLGLVLTEENHGRLFPRSNQAQSVIDVLEEELSKLEVLILYNQKIRNIEYKEKSEDQKDVITLLTEKPQTSVNISNLNIEDRQRIRWIKVPGFFKIYYLEGDRERAVEEFVRINFEKLKNVKNFSKFVRKWNIPDVIKKFKNHHYS